MPPVQRGLCNKIPRIDPTATIWTAPRSNASAKSLSKWILRLRASNATIIAAIAATTACASPSRSESLKIILSMKHLFCAPDFEYATGLENHHPISHARCLLEIVRDQHACQAALVHYCLDE